MMMCSIAVENTCNTQVNTDLVTYVANIFKSSQGLSFEIVRQADTSEHLTQ